MNALYEKGSFICAGKTGADACNGDSGGPLVQYDDDCEPILWGIVSWGQSCRFGGGVGLYVNVGFYMDWLGENMCEFVDFTETENKRLEVTEPPEFIEDWMELHFVKSGNGNFGESVRFDAKIVNRVVWTTETCRELDSINRITVNRVECEFSGCNSGIHVLNCENMVSPEVMEIFYDVTNPSSVYLERVKRRSLISNFSLNIFFKYSSAEKVVKCETKVCKCEVTVRSTISK